MAILALVEDDFEPGIVLTLAENFRLFGAQVFAVVGNTVGQSFQENVVSDCADLHVVDLVEVRVGFSDARGPFRIVGEQEQAFAGFIEAADRGEPVGFIAEGSGKNIVDGLAAFFVGGGGDDAAGFVEYYVEFLGWLDGLAVDFDMVLIQMDWDFGIAAYRGVQGYAAGANQCGGVRAGTEA